MGDLGEGIFRFCNKNKMTVSENIKRKIDRLLSSSTRRRLAHGAFWGGIATAGSRGIAVVASFFLARILGQSWFGEYGMVNSTAGMIGSLAGMGIGLTVTKHVAEFRTSDQEKTGRILALSSIVTIVSAVIYGAAFVLLAPWLATATLAAPHLAPMLQISAATVAFGVLNGVQSSSLAGSESFRVSSLITVGTSIIQTALVVIGSWLFGLGGAVAALALSGMLTVVATHLVASAELKRLKIRLRWGDARQEWRVLVHFSLPTFLTMLTIGPGYWASNAFLANQPNGYAQLGIFNAATQWQGAIVFLPGLVGTAMIPIMSERYGADDLAGSLRVMWRMMGLIAWVVIPVALVVSILSPWIMKAYGGSFVQGYKALDLLCAAAALSAIMYPVSQFVVATGKMWVAFIINSIAIVVLVGASWLLVHWGAEGLSSARLISGVLHSLLFFVLIKTITKNSKKRLL